MKILAIETSCDETACAVVENGVKILSNVVSSSAAMHEKYGGVVPEVAARKQLEYIIPVITEALSGSGLDFPVHMLHTDTIDAIAVTVGPGLIGSLLVGVETAKTISFVTGIPLIPVNHVIAHMYANFVHYQQINENDKLTKQNRIQSGSGLNPSTSSGQGQTPLFPAISLVVSGGHTELYLMESMKKLKWLGGTLDDAAGEAFDKTARLLGFGSRGGIAIQEAANQLTTHNKQLNLKLPRPMMSDKSLNFSFSGLKTAVMREWKKLDSGSPHQSAGQAPAGMTHAFAYEIQEAIADVLVEKTLRAAKQHNAKSILLSGGVAANLRLREKFLATISRQSSAVSFFAPPKELCTDNAVMIAACAFFHSNPAPWKTVKAVPDLSVD